MLCDAHCDAHLCDVETAVSQCWFPLVSALPLHAELVCEYTELRSSTSLFLIQAEPPPAHVPLTLCCWSLIVAHCAVLNID